MHDTNGPSAGAGASGHGHSGEEPVSTHILLREIAAMATRITGDMKDLERRIIALEGWAGAPSARPSPPTTRPAA